MLKINLKCLWVWCKFGFLWQFSNQISHHVMKTNSVKMLLLGFLSHILKKRIKICEHRACEENQKNKSKVKPEWRRRLRQQSSLHKSVHLHFPTRCFLLNYYRNAWHWSSRSLTGDPTQHQCSVSTIYGDSVHVWLLTINPFHVLMQASVCLEQCLVRQLTQVVKGNRGDRQCGSTS